MSTDALSQLVKGEDRLISFRYHAVTGIGSRLPETGQCVLSSGSRFLPVPVSVSLVPAARKRHLRDIFEIPDPNLPIHFVTFRALRRRLSHVIGKK